MPNEDLVSSGSNVQSTVTALSKQSGDIRTASLLQAEVNYVGMSVIVICLLLTLTIVGIILAIPLYLFGGGQVIVAREKRMKDDAKTKLIEFIGVKPRFIDSDQAYLNGNKITGSSIAYHEGRLYIMDKGIAAELPWNLIRTWKWVVQGHDTFLGGSLEAAGNTETARKLASQSSGVFITTKDIEKPVWQFQTMNVAVCNKWHEVLTQMKDGELPAS